LRFTRTLFAEYNSSLPSLPAFLIFCRHLQAYSLFAPKGSRSTFIWLQEETDCNNGVKQA